MSGINRGSLITGDSSNDPSYITVGSANTVLTTDGSDVAWTTITNSMLAGSIANEKLSHSKISVTDGSNSSDISLEGQSLSRLTKGLTLYKIVEQLQ